MCHDAVNKEDEVLGTALVLEDYGFDYGRVGFEVFPTGSPGAGVKDDSSEFPSGQIRSCRM